MKYILDKEKNVMRQVKEKGDEEYKKPGTGYWVRVPEKWWRGALAGLKPIERCILISLRIAGARKPTKSFLARELHTTRYTIIKYLKILKKKGLL